MRNFITIMVWVIGFAGLAQSTITYPYNPDGNADTLIGVTDLQDLLTTYGQPFLPSEILVEGQTLTTVLTDLQQSIDSLSALSGGGGGSVLDMPIGTILPVAIEAVPEGWVLCDGRELAIEDYQGLYDLIGTTYGAGDSAFWAQVFFPATTFNIPDLRGRTIIGANDMGGEAAGIIQHHGGQLGQSGGEELHQLTEEEMPNHSHSIDDYVYRYTATTGYEIVTGGIRVGTYSSKQTNPAGGDQPHNNMQPYIALNYMMKVQAAEDVVAELTGQIATLESQVEELSNTPGFPFAEVQIIECGNHFNCELECGTYLNIGPWGFNCDSANDTDNIDCSASPWNKPSWIRFEVHAPWVSNVEDVRFSQVRRVRDANAQFESADISPGGIGTDRITFTVYTDLSSVSPYQGVPSELLQEAITALKQNCTYGNITRYYNQYMSVLIDGVWYDTGITWK